MCDSHEATPTHLHPHIRRERSQGKRHITWDPKYAATSFQWASVDISSAKRNDKSQMSAGVWFWEGRGWFFFQPVWGKQGETLQIWQHFYNREPGDGSKSHWDSSDLCKTHVAECCWELWARRVKPSQRVHCQVQAFTGNALLPCVRNPPLDSTLQAV